jgi:hypothetical protein
MDAGGRGGVRHLSPPLWMFCKKIKIVTKKEIY